MGYFQFAKRSATLQSENGSEDREPDWSDLLEAFKRLMESHIETGFTLKLETGRRQHLNIVFRLLADGDGEILAPTEGSEAFSRMGFEQDSQAVQIVQLKASQIDSENLAKIMIHIVERGYRLFLDNVGNIEVKPPK